MTSETLAKEAAAFYDAKRVADFNAGHSGQRFTKHFNTAIDAVIRDKSGYSDCRVLAWYIRRSWGNFSDCAVDDETGQIALTQRDCTRDLGLSKSAVSRSVQRLESKFRLQMRGREGYPVVDPIAAAQAANVPKADYVGDNERSFGEYFSNWLRENPAEAEAFTEAQQTVYRIRSNVLAQYKTSEKLQTGGKKSSSDLSQTFEKSGESDPIRPQPEIPDVRNYTLQTDGTENDASYIRFEDLINAPIEAFSPISRASEPEPPATPERETKTYSNEPEQTNIRGSGYEELIELAAAIPIRFTRPETPRIREIFARLTIEDRLHAVQRLREYKAAPPWDPGYEPSLIRYLEDQRWTAIFIPKKRKQAVELLTLEELEDAE